MSVKADGVASCVVYMHVLLDTRKRGKVEKDTSLNFA